MKTNYGEEYNRESMYETAREYFLDGKSVKVNGQKCKGLIEVMLEDFKLEIEKEHNLVEQSQVAWDAKNKEECFDKFSQAMGRNKITNYLQLRLERAFDNLARSKTEKKELTDKITSIKNLEKCTLQQLEELLNALEQYRQNLVYCIDGDLVNTEVYKTFDITNKYIAEVEQELEKRQAHAL